MKWEQQVLRRFERHGERMRPLTKRQVNKLAKEIFFED